MERAPEARARPVSGAGNRVFGLDLLRAAAILFVVSTHFRRLLPADAENVFRLLWGGFLGVEIFFALSGFLIGLILIGQGPGLGEGRTLTEFWRRRWMRTLPNYFLFLGVNVAVHLWLGWSIPSLLSYAVFSQNLYQAHPPLFPEAWSLSVEEWFYFAFPACVFAGTRLLKRFDRAFVLSAALFIVVPAVLRLTLATPMNLSFSEDIRKVVVMRLDAVMFGILAAWAKVAYPQVWKRSRFALPAVGLLILLGLRLFVLRHPPDGSFFAKTWLLSLSGLACALLLPLFDQLTVSRETPWTRAVRCVALWSYSLYLCHHSVLNLIQTVPRPDAAAAWGVWTAGIAMSFGVAALAYRFWEKPIMDLRGPGPGAVPPSSVEPQPVPVESDRGASA